MARMVEGGGRKGRRTRRSFTDELLIDAEAGQAYVQALTQLHPVVERANTYYERGNYQDDLVKLAPDLPDTVPPQLWYHPKGLAVGHSWVINDHVVNSAETVDRERGTKAAFWYRLRVDPGRRAHGRLITGQNPGSARAVGEAVVAELQAG